MIKPYAPQFIRASIKITCVAKNNSVFVDRAPFVNFEYQF